MQLVFFFSTATAATEIYTLSLHDALPISRSDREPRSAGSIPARILSNVDLPEPFGPTRPAWSPSKSPKVRPSKRLRSEEHTSELQSQFHLVCRLLLEKKK